MQTPLSRRIASLLIFAISLWPLSSAWAKGDVYVIELLSSKTPIDANALPSSRSLQSNTLYTSIQQSGESYWHQLRVGFFNTRNDAVAVAHQRFLEDYPRLWIARISPKEVEASLRQKIDVPDTGGVPALTNQQQVNLMKQGQAAMARKNFAQASELYRELVKSGSRETREDAQYYLALSLEQQGHLALAKMEYENYLRHYPNGANASQSQERLSELLEVGHASPEDQSRYRQEIQLNGTTATKGSSAPAADSERVDMIATSTSVDTTWRLPNEQCQVKAVVLGDFEQDNADAWGNTLKLSLFYLDHNNLDEGTASRWGRQAASGGGVLGGFDGGRFSYLVGDGIRLNLVAGLPVEADYSSPDAQTFFYGVNVDLGRFANYWDLHAFVINQMAEGFVDRQALGGEIRFTGTRTNLLSSVDYDLLFNELNKALLSGNWLFPNEKTRLNFTAEYRQSQILRTSNALVGQSSTSLDLLARELGETAMRRLAADRTRDRQLISLGLSHSVARNIELVGDISWDRLSGAPASGGVDAISSTGSQYFYSAQLIGSDLTRMGDKAILGLRYGVSDPQDSYTLTLNTQYPLQDRWRINPKMQLDYLASNLITDREWRFQPSLGVECRLANRWRVDLEGGVNMANEELNGLTDELWQYFVSFGIKREL